MKPILLITGMLFLYSDILSAGLTENRIYPRIVKAENLIAAGDKNKAQKLLEETIDIDTYNQRALKMLVVLCSDKEDLSCIQEYSRNIDDKNFVNYYRAYAFYLQKKYAYALKTLNAIEIRKLPEQKQFQAAIWGVKSAIFLGKHNEISAYLSILSSYWKHKEHLQSFHNITTLLIDNGFYALGMDQVRFAQNYGILFNDKILENWAYRYQKAHQYEQALMLVEKIQNPNIRYNKKVLLLSEMGQFQKAAKEMENLYALDSTESNKKRLLYLYNKANMTQKEERLYLQSLNKTCDASALRNLLQLYPSGTKREILLEKYKPFPCLDKNERFNLTLELLKKQSQTVQTAKTLSLLKSLSQIKNLNNNQQKILSFWYAKINNYNKAAALMEKVYRKQPDPENKKQLVYLYEKAKDEKKLETFHTNILKKRCSRESLLFILSRHNKINTLKKYYPYSCLKTTEQFNYTLKLVQAYKKKKNNQKALHILHTLAKHSKLTSKEYRALSIEYASLGQKTKSLKYAHKAYNNNHRDIYAIKQLAYDYEQNNQPMLAIKYYKKALTLDPKDTKLNLAIGSLYAKVNKPKQALYYWDKCLRTHHTQNLILLSAEQAMLIPDVPRTKRYLNMIFNVPKKRALQYRYYILKSKIAHANNHPKKERFYYKKAIASNPYRGAQYYADLGYIYYEDQNFTAAVKAFKKVLSYGKVLKYNDQLGFTYEKLGERDKAVKTFKRSIDMINTMPNPDLLHRYKLKQEIDNSRSFYGYIAYTSRLDGYTQVPISTAIPQSSYNGFAMIELSYKPQKFKNHLFFYLHGLSSVENKSLALEDQTWQPSIGVRYKPFDDQLLTFSIERFFKGGDKSREDTMIRAETAFFDDYHFHPIETDYWYKNLYLDSAYYIEDDIYSLFANYEHGYVTKLGYEHAIMPYVSTSASLHNDNYKHDQIKNIDVGIGVSLFFWWNEQKYRPHQFSGRLSIEGRRSLHHTLDDDQTVKMKFELFF